MYEKLSPSQEERFCDISGKRYVAHHEYEVDLRYLAAGTFMTEYPCNNRDWDMSPWRFTFVLEKQTGHFICELRHRMTNNRIYGWDQEGNELPDEVLHNFFSPDYVFEE